MSRCFEWKITKKEFDRDGPCVKIENTNDFCGGEESLSVGFVFILFNPYWLFIDQ